MARIQEGLGFRTTLSTSIISRLQEAQRDLEAGKTLPRFLLQEDATFVIPAGEHAVVLPSGFIRIDDEGLPHFVTSESDTPIFLEGKRYQAAVEGNVRVSNVARAPAIFVLRKTTLDVIVEVDRDYTFKWSYYKRAAVLSGDIENEWLGDVTGGAEWLMGEAGLRLARDLRDQSAGAVFEAMRTAGRAACFGEILARETQSGGFEMGEAN